MCGLRHRIKALSFGLAEEGVRNPKGIRVMSKNRIQAQPLEGRLPEKTVNPVEHYHPIEHAVLAEYLDRKERLPAEAAEIDPHEVIPLDADWDESKKGIAPRPGQGGSDLALENAVARIVLSPIRSKLPRWGYWDGKEVFDTRAAKQNGELPQRSFHSEPLLVLSINWADSGPGYSYPENYYIAWVPFYDRYVVTVSADTPYNGYLDFAIGWLKEDGNVGTDIRSIVERRWSDLSLYLEAWQDCLDSGIVPDPYAWRNSVWHEEAEEWDE